MSPMQIKDEINSEDKNNSVKLEENQESTSKNGNGGSPNLFPINNNDLKDLGMSMSAFYTKKFLKV